MTQAYPVPLNDFWSLLVPYMASVKPFKLERRQQSSGMGTGQTLVADVGPGYWKTAVSFRALYSSEMRMIMSLMDVLDGSLNDFYAYDPLGRYPASDPNGNALQANANAPIIVSEVRNNGKEMKFTGFPNGFEISQGSMFQYNYGPSSVYRALHRVYNTSSANGSGASGWVEFRPPLPDPDLSVGKVTDWLSASCRMKIVPGSFEEGDHEGVTTTGMGFQCEQIP